MVSKSSLRSSAGKRYQQRTPDSQPNIGTLTQLIISQSVTPFITNSLEPASLTNAKKINTTAFVSTQPIMT